jgi:competence protein ComEC
MRFHRILILLPLLLGITPTKAEPSNALMTIAFIDVGQGDATLIRDGNGFDVLVDGGRKSASDDLLEYIRQVGVDDLEVVLATHADSDHIGGLIAVLEAVDIPVENVYFNGYPGDTQTWTEFSSAVTSTGLSLNQAQFPETYSWGGINVQVINPLPSMVDPDQNKASIVLLLDYAQVTVLLPADIDSSVENQLSSRTVSLQADILKVAHHGSKFSTSQSFLQDVLPQEAVISVGANPHDHPTIETLTRLAEIGANIWRTDYFGTVLLTSNGESYEMLPKLTFLPFSFHTIFFPK